MASPKDIPRDIGGFIQDLRRSARISLRQLAAQAGVSNPYLSQIERGLRKPSAEVLQQIATALRVSTPAMYLRAGLLDDRDGPGVLAAIAADPELTMAQKQSLSQIYETFRRENARHAEASATGAPADGGAAGTSAGDHAAGTSDEWAASGLPTEGAGTVAPTVVTIGTPVDPVIESVAVTESGGAPAPGPAKKTARKAVRRTAPRATKAAPVAEEEK
ncbi:MAG TPA: helix-turn-helix domain-containing protein [Micromonospora sp.]